jgi:hypothetical protein
MSRSEDRPSIPLTWIEDLAFWGMSVGSALDGPAPQVVVHPTHGEEVRRDLDGYHVEVVTNRHVSPGKAYLIDATALQPPVADGWGITSEYRVPLEYRVRPERSPHWPHRRALPPQT